MNLSKRKNISLYLDQVFNTLLTKLKKGIFETFQKNYHNLGSESQFLNVKDPELHFPQVKRTQKVGPSSHYRKAAPNTRHKSTIYFRSAWQTKDPLISKSTYLRIRLGQVIVVQLALSTGKVYIGGYCIDRRNLLL